MTQRIAIPDTQILDPLYANIQPKSAPGQIAKSVKPKLDILTARQVSKIVVLIDREDQLECPSELAQGIENAFRKLGHSNVHVAIKNRRFENWLISDTKVFKKLSARYKTTAAFTDNVIPNKADSVENATGLLNKICVGTEYHKRRDAAQITKHQDISEVSKNSRSFRRFLRLLGHQDYETQSKKPSTST